MRKTLLIAATVAMLTAATPASAADVATFLAQADRLMHRGPLAFREMRALMGQIERSNATLRAERQAAERQGRRPAFCPDPARPATPREIFRALQAVPVSQRANTSVTDALRTFYARRYPCPT